MAQQIYYKSMTCLVKRIEQVLYVLPKVSPRVMMFSLSFSGNEVGLAMIPARFEAQFV